MRCFPLIVALTMTVAISFPTDAGPPAQTTQRSKSFAAPPGVPGGRPPFIQQTPRFSPKLRNSDSRTSPPIGRFKPPVVNAPPRMVPKDGRGDRGVFTGPAALDAVDRMRDPPVGPIELADSDGDGIPDWREDLVIGIDPGLIGGDAGGGVDPAPPAADPVSPVADAVPTAWDWVAIGLAAAAFADGLADRRQGSGGDAVVIERPIVQVVPADPVVKEHTVSPQPVVSEETGAVAETVSSIEEPAAKPLPQLRAGEGFHLPTMGLGRPQGRVAVKVGAVILECPVTAWNEAGIEATVPATTLAAATRADLIVALSDGKVAAVVPVEMLPAAQPGEVAAK